MECWKRVCDIGTVSGDLDRHHETKPLGELLARSPRGTQPQTSAKASGSGPRSPLKLCVRSPWICTAPRGWRRSGPRTVCYARGCAGCCARRTPTLNGPDSTLQPGPSTGPGTLGFLRRQTVATQQFNSAAHHFVEHAVVGSLRSAGEAGARQPHGESVAGEHGHAARVVADQRVKAPADVDRRMPVVGDASVAVHP